MQIGFFYSFNKLHIYLNNFFQNSHFCFLIEFNNNLYFQKIENEIKINIFKLKIKLEIKLNIKFKIY